MGMLNVIHQEARSFIGFLVVLSIATPKCQSISDRKTRKFGNHVGIPSFHGSLRGNSRMAELWHWADEKREIGYEKEWIGDQKTRRSDPNKLLVITYGMPMGTRICIPHLQ